MNAKNNPPSSIKLIVFDWDGTLMDSQDQIVSALMGAIKDLQLETRSYDECKNIIGLGLKEAMLALYPDSTDQQLDEFVTQYRKHWFGNAQESQLFPGVVETLDILKEAGFLLAVATGKARAGLERVLKQTNLGHYFDASRCADEARSKPHPDMLLDILKKLQVAPDETLVVGDTEFDLGMAANADVASIAVSFGVHERERLMKHEPLTCLDQITELVDYLAEANVLDYKTPQTAQIAGE